MGIVSAITKVAKSAVKAVSKGVSKVGGSRVSKGMSNVKRAVKAAPDFIFGDQAGTVSNAMKKASGSIFAKAKAGAKAAIRETERVAAKQGGNFFTRLFKNTKKIFTDIPKHFKLGKRAAAIAGKKAGLKAGLGGVFKGLAKKMPLIGSLVTIGLEVPNIWSAGKDEGFGTALKEAGKAVLRLGGAAVGAVAGTFLGGPMGGIAGFAAGEWLVGKLTGDTYSDKKDFLKEQGIDDAALKQLKEQGYSFDDIYKQVKAESKVAEAQGELEEVQSEIAENQGVAQSEVPPAEQTTPQEVPGTQSETQLPQGENVYSEEAIGILRSLGLSDEDILVLQQAGIPVEEAVKMAVDIKAAGNTSPAGASQVNPDTTQIVQQPVVQQQDTDYLEPFVLPYQGAFNNNGTYNSGLYNNPYSTDMFYNNTFGYNNQTNPFNYNTNTSNSDLYGRVYKQNGQLGFNASF